MVQVSGPSDSGKTTLIERLIPRLVACGLRVGTVKHAHDGFELDHPGKDSWRHAQAGAEAVAIIAPTRAAWIVHTPEALSCREAAALIGRRVDLIFIEGFTREAAPPSLRLQPGSGARLGIMDGCCRIGVHPAELAPDEVESIVQFCVDAVPGGAPCRPR